MDSKDQWNSIISLTEDSEFRLSPAEGLPMALQEAARDIAPDISEARWFQNDEIKAARALLETASLTPVWNHIDRFIEPHHWYDLMVKVFIEPYGYPEAPFYNEDAAEQQALKYARVAEHAHELRELLQELSFNDDAPGYLPEVSELVRTGDLEKNLLKLVSLTTACKWPAIHYAQRYGSPNDFPPESWQGFSPIDYEDCYRAETFNIFRPTKKQSQQECLTPGYRGYDYHGSIFQRNPKFYSKYETNPAYQYDTDEERDVFLTKDDVPPPIFEPREFPEYAADKVRANSPHIKYLKQMLNNMDDFSSQLGRPQRTWNRGPGNPAGKNQPLWLSCAHARSILGALFLNPDGEPWPITDDQINRELKKCVS